MNKSYDLRNGDCIKVLNTFEDGWVDLTVTSPPYDNLRNYNGNNDLWNEGIWKDVIKELYRVTRDGGIVVWIVGDATINGSETGTSFKQALWAKEMGFNLHDTMIYAKKNPIPQNHNRYEQCFEYMFVLSKGKPNIFNPIKTITKNAGKEMEWGNRKTEMDINQARRHRGSDIIEVKSDKNHNNIFEYSIGGGTTGHPAVFPLQLATDHIVSWSNKGDIVLDCFMGSGTTGIAALNLERKFIGIELDKTYFELAKERIESHKPQMELF